MEIGQKATTTLITGGAGFIGSYLAEQLVTKGQVISLDIQSPTRPIPGVLYQNGDVRSAEHVRRMLKGVGRVVHFAADVSVPVCQNRPLESSYTNLMGTHVVLEEVRRLQDETGQKVPVLFASSAAVYGGLGQASGSLREVCPLPPPSSMYAFQKLAGEGLLDNYHRFYGVRSFALRFFNVYGVGQASNSPYSGVITKFAEAVRHGQKIRIFGDGKSTRDFVHVRDVASACERVLDQEASWPDGFRVANVGTGTSVTISELAQLILQIGAQAGSRQKHFVEHLEERAGDVRYSCADISLLSECFNWMPTVSLRDGLTDLLNASSSAAA